MKIIKINKNNPDSQTILKAVEVIKNGGAVVLPTDTAYGIAVNALDERALERLGEIKGRPKEKPYPVAVGDLEQAREYVILNDQDRKLADNFWPGKLTLILNQKKEFALTKFFKIKTVAIRIPDSPLVLKILKMTGFPITLTSANRSGLDAAYGVGQVLKQWQNQSRKPDLILDGGDLAAGVISTIVDLTGKEVKVVRRGAVEIN